MKRNSWRRLPDRPQALAGSFAGVSNGALIVAGGSYFLQPPWAGGKKLFADRIDVLDRVGGRWRSLWRLERPLAQGASVTTDDGVICLGGGDADRYYRSVFRLRWTGMGIEREPLPDLPRPVGFLSAVQLGTFLYVAGGSESPTASEALRSFWRLDLTAGGKGRWEELPPWPGPGRIGAALVARDGAVYLFSGATLSRGRDGKPVREYLRDAYRYRPNEGWRRIAAVPRPAVAAPVASGEGGRILLLGGDDGANATRVEELKDRHPGFRRDVQVYDTSLDRWTVVPDALTAGLVTTNAVSWRDTVVIPGGEDRPGHRSALVFAMTTLISGQNNVAAAAVDTPVQTPLFVAGTEGYHTFRIPSLLMTPRGTLLAFCEGRKNGGGDSGAIDLVLRRSKDGGRTWGPLQVVWTDRENTCGNPCPVCDQETGTIWLPMTHNLGQDREAEIIAGTSEGTRTVWICRSEDEGATWSMPQEITSTTKRAEWTWYATGPGVGIQLRKGPHKGRLVIPCNHEEDRKSVSHVIYSDDHGKTWRLGGSSSQKRTNESQVVELSDGRLLLNMRSSDRSHKERGVCLSADGGETWSDFRHETTLIEPICQGSVIAYTSPGGSQTLLFSNPADREERKNLTVRLSRDDGKTWSTSRTLCPGAAAYSCLTILAPGEIGCLYECGEVKPYETITFARFSPDWLTGPAK